MARVVCYSLLFPSDRKRSDLLWQLEASVASLRAYNRDISIVVFMHGASTAGVESLASKYDFVVSRQGSYEERLAVLMPHAWSILREYPVLHKFMNFASIGRFGVDQALLLDCDTVFSDDVGILFERYSSADVYAREEPTCRRSHYGYDPSYIDEDALLSISAAEGTVTPPPFNLGVVLLNNGRWAELDALVLEFLTYVWRFMIWMALHPPSSDTELAFGEGLGIDALRRDWESLVAPPDIAAALRFPSSNRWINEEVAVWLALGKLAAGSYGDFSRADVIQNGEFDGQHTHDHSWVVCHYFSQNTKRIAEWLGSSESRYRAPSKIR